MGRCAGSCLDGEDQTNAKEHFDVDRVGIDKQTTSAVVTIEEKDSTNEQLPARGQDNAADGHCSPLLHEDESSSPPDKDDRDSHGAALPHDGADKDAAHSRENTAVEVVADQQHRPDGEDVDGRDCGQLDAADGFDITSDSVNNDTDESTADNPADDDYESIIRRKLEAFLSDVPIGSTGPQEANSERSFDATPLVRFAVDVYEDHRRLASKNVDAEEIYSLYKDWKLARADAEDTDGNSAHCNQVEFRTRDDSTATKAERNVATVLRILAVVVAVVLPMAWASVVPTITGGDGVLRSPLDELLNLLDGKPCCRHY